LHIHFLDPYQAGESPIHLADPRVKFVLTMVFILTAAMTPIGAWSIYILLYATILSLIIVSGVGVKNVLRRSLLALPFALAALPLLFTTPGQQIFTITLRGWEITATIAGLERFTSRPPGSYARGARSTAVGGDFWIDVALSICVS
jgi:cobalt/nickel transport system permease protein